jgi:hypothetical protein
MALAYVAVSIGVVVASALLFLIRPRQWLTALGGVLVGCGGVIAGWSPLFESHRSARLSTTGMVFVVVGLALSIVGGLATSRPARRKQSQG